jgi:hypothetical protein
VTIKALGVCYKIWVVEEIGMEKYLHQQNRVVDVVHSWVESSNDPGRVTVEIDDGDVEAGTVEEEEMEEDEAEEEEVMEEEVAVDLLLSQHQLHRGEGKGDSVVSIEGKGRSQTSLCETADNVEVGKGNEVQQKVHPTKVDGVEVVADKSHLIEFTGKGVVSGREENVERKVTRVKVVREVGSGGPLEAFNEKIRSFGFKEIPVLLSRSKSLPFLDGGGPRDGLGVGNVDGPELSDTISLCEVRGVRIS